jgi:RNA polymerase sigma factor (sigma-70 family)
MARSDAKAKNDAVADLDAGVAAFADHFDYLCRMLRRFGVEGRDIEDLAQDVFVIMCRRWGDYQPDRPLRPWLVGIAAHLARRHLARAWRETPAQRLDGEDQGRPPDEQLDSTRAERLVLAALDALSPRDRAVLVLHEIQGLPMQEVATQLSVPLFTAYTRLRRARLRFARAVEQRQAGAGERARALLARLAPSIDRPLPPAPAPFAPILLTAALAAVVGLAAFVVSGRREAPPPTVVVRPAAHRERPAAPLGPAEGLSGYWRFDEAAGSGLARDLSGHGADCVLRDLDPQRARVDGVLGGAIDVRGGWIECPRAGVPQAPEALSVSAWVNVAQLRGQRAIIGRQLAATHGDDFLLSLMWGRLKVRSTLWRMSITARDQIPAGRWVHVAFTHSSDGTTRLYQDGVEVGRHRSRASATEPTLARPIAIGVDVNDAGRLEQPLLGSVDEVAVYDRALRPDEIAALAAGAQPPVPQ